VSFHEEERQVRNPETSDNVTAARNASGVVFLAAVWLFVSPFAYYGVSDQRNAWNSWIAGVLMILLSGARLWRPLSFAAFSWVNMILGIWVAISPWVFGYVGDSARLTNSLCVGLIVLGCSIAAVWSTFRPAGSRRVPSAR
jgi:hypothetical protein